MKLGELGIASSRYFSRNPDDEESKTVSKVLRSTHPDTGDDDIKVDVAKRIQELTEARRILLR